MYAKILKANPYHDAKGKFTSKGKHTFQSIGPKFSKSTERDKAEHQKAQSKMDGVSNKKQTAEEKLASMKSKARVYSPDQDPDGTGRGVLAHKVEDFGIKQLDEQDKNDAYTVTSMLKPKDYKPSNDSVDELFGIQNYVRHDNVQRALDSYKKTGKLDPVEVLEIDGKKTLMDGHHRLVAAKLLGLKTIPTRKAKFTDAELTARLEQEGE